MNPAQLTIVFAGEEDAQRVEHATEFAVFWRDRFGTVHYAQVPWSADDGFDWWAWFHEKHDHPDAPPKAINRDSTGLSID